MEFFSLLEEKELISVSFIPRETEFTYTKNPVLSFAWLEITNRCNLKCVHCYEGNTHPVLQNELSVDEWKKILNELYSIGCHSVMFIGGEPCANLDLEKLLQHAGFLGFKKISLFTNATLLTEQLLDTIFKLKVYVKISIYGHTALVHDSITGVSGSFERMLFWTKKMLDKGINITPSVVIMKENQDYFQEIREFITAIGLKYNGYDVIRNIYGGTQQQHVVTKSDILMPLLRSNPEFYAKTCDMQKKLFTNTCWYGKVAIASNGDVFPCEFERKITYGNIRVLSLEQMLQSELLRKMWFLDFSNIQNCSKCEYRLACKDCRPLAKSISGDILSQNPRCLYDPYTGIWNTNCLKTEEKT